MTYGLDAMRVFLLYVLPATLGLASLAMFLILMSRTSRIEGRVDRNDQALESKAVELTKALAMVRQELELERLEKTRTVAAPVPGTGSNSTTRAKALKMHRLGNSADQIATALRVPKGEVTLLLKVHNIALQPFEQEPAEMMDEERLIDFVGQKV